jgi:hypothetical protein
LNLRAVDGSADPARRPVVAKTRFFAAEAETSEINGLGPLAREPGLSPAEATRAAQLEAALLSRFRGVLCPSRRTAATVESYGISPDRIAIVPPGTAKPNRHLRPRRGRVRALLSVANLVPRKGHRVLVEALARIPRRGGGNALTAPGKARDRRLRGAVRGGFGSEPASARRDRRADGVSFLPGARQLHQRRYLLRRLRRRLPQAKIVDGFWTLTAQEAEDRNALAATRADWLVTSLRQAVEQVVDAAKEAASADLEDEIRAPVVVPPQRQCRVIQSWNFPLYSINSSVPNPGMKNPPLPIISDRPPRRGCSYEKQAEPECAGGHIGNRDKPARSTGSTR